MRVAAISSGKVEQPVVGKAVFMGVMFKSSPKASGVECSGSAWQRTQCVFPLIADLHYSLNRPKDLIALESSDKKLLSGEWFARLDGISRTGSIPPRRSRMREDPDLCLVESVSVLIHIHKGSPGQLAHEVEVIHFQDLC